MLLAQSGSLVAEAAHRDMARRQTQGVAEARKAWQTGRGLAVAARPMLKRRQICVPVSLGLTVGARAAHQNFSNRILDSCGGGRVPGAVWLDVFRRRS